MSFVTRVFSPIFTALKPAARFFVSTLYIWMFLAGVACIFIGGLKLFGLSDGAARAFESIGITILTGGVFAILLKSFQFNSVFKDELNDVIYGSKKPPEGSSLTVMFREELNRVIYGATSEEQKAIVAVLQDELCDIIYGDNYLKGRKDVEEVWRRVSRALYQSKFREISDKIEGKILKMYLPTAVNFYYDELAQVINITFHDKEKKYLNIAETFKFTIKAVDTSRIDLPYHSAIKKDPSDTVSRYELVKIMVNGVDKTSQSNPDLNKADGEELLSEFSLPLEGAIEYKVSIKHNKIYELDKDNTRVFTARRFANTLELYVKHPSELEVAFFPLGTPHEEKFESKLRDDPSVMWKEYKHLMFPNQGYMLVFSRRQENANR